MYFIGIDPGQRGGIALLGDGPNGLWCCTAFIPYDNKRICVESFVSKLYIHHSINPEIWVEKANSMTGQGVASTCNFCRNAGIIEGAVRVSFPGNYHEVYSKTWKKKVLGTSSADKQIAIEHVQNKYPEVNLIPEGKRVPQDGLADAVCIAEYGYILWKESIVK